MGAATVAVEETWKLPQTILMYPMTLASQAAHIVMRWQQGLAELANKGDLTLDNLFPPKNEQPEWATFDEDLDPADPVEVAPAEAGGLTEGRFALYSFSDAGTERPAAAASTGEPAAETPALVTELGYPQLTLAQLRARLNSLGLEDLETLLAYEEATRARAPFQTLLANRITRTTAK